MNEKRGQYAYEIGHVFPTNHGSMAVIARQKVEKKPDHFRKYYTLRCGRGHQYEVGESYLQQGRLRTCKHCLHPSIAETDPDFALWFAESKGEKPLFAYTGRLLLSGMRLIGAGQEYSYCLSEKICPLPLLQRWYELSGTVCQCVSGTVEYLLS